VWFCVCITMPRDRCIGYWRLMNDYFFDNLFRRRYVLHDPHHCTYVLNGVVLCLRQSHIYWGEYTSVLGRAPHFFRVSTILLAQLLVRDTYLRQPNSEDIVRLLDIAQQRGVSRMLRSIDGMYWEWECCSTLQETHNYLRGVASGSSTSGI
jgi:hypothetical protein